MASSALNPKMFRIMRRISLILVAIAGLFFLWDLVVLIFTGALPSKFTVGIALFYVSTHIPLFVSEAWNG